MGPGIQTVFKAKLELFTKGALWPSREQVEVKLLIENLNMNQVLANCLHHIYAILILWLACPASLRGPRKISYTRLQEWGHENAFW